MDHKSDTKMAQPVSRQVSKSDADVALGIFEDLKSGHITETADDSKVLWKVDMRLMPLL